MRKLFSFIVTLTLSIGLWAQEINAVKVIQTETTDWYLLGNSNQVLVTFNNGNPVFQNKTYDLAQGEVITAFGTAPEDTWFTVRTDSVAGNWNTICLEKNITAIDGATFWNVVGEDATSFILDQVTEPQAGYGYLIRFTATELKVQYGDQVADAPVTATDGNPVQGTFTMIEPAESNALTGNYVVYNNQLRPAGAWVGLKDHRAYVVADLVSDNVPEPVPGRARMYMPKPNQTPTGLGQWNKEQGQRTVKFLRNGQLVIMKDNKMYNAQGMKL